MTAAAPTAADLAARYAPLTVDSDVVMIRSQHPSQWGDWTPYGIQNLGSLQSLYSMATEGEDALIADAVDLVAEDLERDPRSGRLVMAVGKAPTWEGPWPPIDFIPDAQPAALAGEPCIPACGDPVDNTATATPMVSVP